MKITQTDSQIELKNSGLGNVFWGAGTVITGIVVLIFFHGGTDGSGKKIPIWAPISGAALIIFGALLLYMAKNRQTTIQRAGNVTVSMKRVLGGKPEQQSIPVADVVAVRLSTYLEPTTASDGARTNSRRSTLMLLLRNNDLIEIGSSSSGSGLSINGLNVTSLINKAPLSKEANQVAQFLGVPLQSDDTSSIAGAVNSVKAAFEHGSPDQPAQPASFNPNPQQPVPPIPPATPAPPQPPTTQPVPTPQQVPPSENPNGPTAPPPPYTPQQ